MARRFKLRPGPVGVAITVFDIWRRLPPKQRQQVIVLVRRHGPRVASQAWKLRRNLKRR